MGLRIWQFVPVLALAACGNEREVVSPQLEEPVDDTASIVNTTPEEPGVTRGMALNRDGTFQLSNLDSVSHRWFPDWDTVRDNRLVRGEFEAGWTAAGMPGAGTAFERLDRNKDGAISREEFQSRGLWQTLDQNGDGTLTRAELSERTAD